MAIRGVTFDNQQVTASDHGALFKEIFPTDGILIGCAITASGSNISIAAGYMVVAGRLFQNTASYTLTAAASGNYVRVLATIDTSQTATTSEFAQVSFSLDYAATVSGFPALTQDDINAGSGNIYQAALAIYALSGSTVGAIADGPNYATVSAQYATNAGNAATATALASARNFTIADNDGSHTGPATAFKGIAAALLKLPATIKATFIGPLTGNVTGNVSGSSGSCTGNAATATTATKVGHALSIGGTTFDGSAARTISANDITYLGATPISSVTDDTPQNWRTLGFGMALYNATGQITDQPSQYGVLISFPAQYLITQLWISQAGGLYKRSGNSSAGINTWNSTWSHVTVDSDIPAASTTAPSMDGTASYGSGTAYARANHVHPTDTSRAPLASPTFTGTPKAPTAAAGTNTQQLATTEFVTRAVGGVSVPAASTTAPLMDGTASYGSGTAYARANHVHPTDTSRAAASAIPAASTTTPKMDGTAAAGTGTTWARGDHVHPTDTSRAAASHTHNASDITGVNTSLNSFSGRRIYISQNAPNPSQGSIGDIWIQY